MAYLTSFSLLANINISISEYFFLFWKVIEMLSWIFLSLLERKIFVVVFIHQYRSLLIYDDFWEPLKCEKSPLCNQQWWCQLNSHWPSYMHLHSEFWVPFLLHLLYSRLTLQRQCLICRFSYTVDRNVSVITMTKPKSLTSTGISLRKCKSSSKSSTESF